MTKMWNCRFKGKFLAITRNTLTPALQKNQPDIDAIRAALPRRYQSMRLDCWLTYADIGPTVHATVWLIGIKNTKVASVSCDAYELEA